MLQQGIPNVGCSLCDNNGNGAASSELSEVVASDWTDVIDAAGRLDLCLKNELSTILLRDKGVPADVSVQRGTSAHTGRCYLSRTH